MKPRQELLTIEKKIFRQNQETIDDSADVRDRNFDKYHATYRRAVAKYTRPATPDQVEKDLRKSRVVLVGDYHTLDQSQRSFVRVLRHVIRKGFKDFVVALETVQSGHQKHLDRFMASEIDDKTFIKNIGFKKSWFFDLWQNYAVIFDFLKFHKIPVYGIEASGHDKKTLTERDKHMAGEICKIAASHPDKIVFVLVGDLHLAPKHLPKDIADAAKKSKQDLPTMLLYQNSPEIYWKLAEKDTIDHTLIVRLGERAYCRMHTPPIIVQQSYINWLYHDEGVFDWVDAKASFIHLVERIAQIVGITLPVDYEDVEVYTCGDLGFMKLLGRKKLFNKREIEFIRHQIENSESYFLPRVRIAYIANVSIHHAAEEASHYLKILMAGDEFARDWRDAFYANVLHEAVGFFGSKLVNAKRKCARLADFVAQNKFFEKVGKCPKNHVACETAALFVRQAKISKQGQLLPTAKIAALSRELFLSLTHALGYDVGEQLYYAFMAGQVSRDFVASLYKNKFEEEGSAGKMYLELVRKLRGVKRPGNI